MNKIRVIIVDDEHEAREGIQFLLDNLAEIEVLGVCKNGIDAIELINSLEPDLVLLDIQMPGVNGFEVLNSIKIQPLPGVIFITAYDEFALKAFEVHALDYLLKPFTDRRFNEAMSRAKSFIKKQKMGNGDSALKNLMVTVEPQYINKENNQMLEVPSESKKVFNDRLIIKADGKIHFVPLKDIVWVQAFDYYVKVHVANQFYLVRDSLKKMESNLPETDFIRIHKSSIVNINYIKELVPHFNNEFIVNLSNGEKIKTSRNYKETLKERFGI